MNIIKSDVFCLTQYTLYALLRHSILGHGQEKTPDSRSKISDLRYFSRGYFTALPRELKDSVSLEIGLCGDGCSLKTNTCRRFGLLLPGMVRLGDPRERIDIARGLGNHYVRRAGLSSPRGPVGSLAAGGQKPQSCTFGGRNQSARGTAYPGLVGGRNPSLLIRGLA